MSDDVGDRLARIETKVDMLLEFRKEDDKRLRGVENKQWLHTGGIAVVSVLAAKLGFFPLIK